MNKHVNKKYEYKILFLKADKALENIVDVEIKVLINDKYLYHFTPVYDYYEYGFLDYTYYVISIKGGETLHQEYDWKSKGTNIYTNFKKEARNIHKFVQSLPEIQYYEDFLKNAYSEYSKKIEEEHKRYNNEENNKICKEYEYLYDDE